MSRIVAEAIRNRAETVTAAPARAFAAYGCSMPRRARVDFEGATHHVMSRGNNRDEIFWSAGDRRLFLSFLERTVSRCHWRCHSYCLMANHYHLVVETPQPTLSLGMQLLNSGYTQAINRARQRVGHVFQSRFTSVVIERDAHFIELVRYLALNPVRAGLCEHPEEWPWSSYGPTVGLRPCPRFLSTDRVLSQFAPSPERARPLCREFVAMGLATQGAALPHEVDPLAYDLDPELPATPSRSS
ncbi:MAG: REP-associated tyrosine transposase [Gaiellales bacterium]